MGVDGVKVVLGNHHVNSGVKVLGADRHGVGAGCAFGGCWKRGTISGGVWAGVVVASRGGGVV